jgi:ADP-heptose:LPS heptosyltransferase
MVCTTPAFRAIREVYPEARIDLVASEGNRSVVARNPHIDNLYAFPLKKIWQWPYHFLKYKLGGYDLVVAFNGQSKTTARLARFIHAPETIGSWARATESYYDRTVPMEKGTHTIEYALKIAEEIGATSKDTSMVFPVSAELMAQMDARFPRRNGKKRIALFIGNAKKTQTRWPQRKFIELADRLVDRGDAEVYIVAGPADERLLSGFSWSEERLHYPGGSLEELGAFLRTCDLFVSSASGPMHLAAAIDVPTVAIVSEYSYECWRPLPDIHTSVRSGEEGVRNVTVDEVEAAVTTQLKEKMMEG